MQRTELNSVDSSWCEGREGADSIFLGERVAFRSWMSCSVSSALTCRESLLSLPGPSAEAWGVRLRSACVSLVPRHCWIRTPLLVWKGVKALSEQKQLRVNELGGNL